MPRTAMAFRPHLLAAAILLATPLSGAFADDSIREYHVPAGPLASTLNRIAAEGGLSLSLDPALAAGRSARAVDGRYDAVGALQQALQGSGLELVQSPSGSYTLRPVPQDTLSMSATTVSGALEDPQGPAQGYVATRTVAGTKTDTPILEVPRSISVVTREQMDDRQVQSLDDAVRYMPGTIASSYGSDLRAEWIRVRGFVPTQFLDGLPLPKGSFANPKAETWNMERVSMLRGPASSLYGQTPPGGLLDMASRRPQSESSHEVVAQGGSNNHKQINFDSTGKIDDDGKMLYRVSGVVRDSGTPIDHADNKRYNIAPSVTWNFDEDTSLTFLSQYTRDDIGTTGGFLPHQGTKLDAPSGKISHHKNLGDPDFDFYDRTYYALGYAFEHRINDVWQFRQNLRYTKSDLEFQGAIPIAVIDDAGTLSRMAQITDEDISQFAVDNNFQADFQTGAISHTLLLGLDNQRANTNYDAPFAFFTNVPNSNVIKPIYGQDFSNVDYNFTFGDYNQKLQDTGVYVQDQMALDKWRLNLGVRQDWTHLSTKFHNQGDATSTDRDTAVTSNAAISYIFDSGIAPYFSYAESFQLTPGATATDAFKPTEGEQYEVGVKYQPVGTDILLTAAYYDLTQKNVSVTEGLTTSQAGKVKVKGFEFEANANVTPELKLIASYAYTDAKLVNGVDDGNRLQLIPFNQASFWADYTWLGGMLDGFGVGGGVRYVDDTYGANSNAPITNVGSYAVYDAAVHYDLGKLASELKGASVAVNATNLFDKDYLSTCDALWCYYGDERNVTASVSYKW